MIKWLALLLSFLLTSGASAKTLAVQSGEHADFSRIVILFDDVPNWTLGKVAKGYELRVEDESVEYDLSTVFELIPKTRLTAIKQKSGGRLTFVVTCNCHADAFEIRSGLVVDIKGGPANSRSPFEVALPEVGDPATLEATARRPVPRPERVTMQSPSTFPATTFEHVKAPRTQFAWRTDLLGTPDPDLVAAETVAEAPEIPPETSHSAPLTDPVADAQSDLIVQLGRAASQGLISADLSETDQLIGDALVDETAHPEMMEATDASTDLLEIIEQTFNENVSFETAIDRSRNERVANKHVNINGDECLASAPLDIANWGKPPTDQDPVTFSRAGIIGEFDFVDTEEIEKLAKQYLYYTFGAEAGALIDIFNADFEHVELLLNLAQVMDASPVGNPVLDHAQLQCETNAALWAALIAETLPRSGQIATEAILASFADLPLHLRRHLGPNLAAKFVEIGETETAMAIKDTIARAPGDHGDGFTMMSAGIALKNGGFEAGANQLTSVIEGDGPNAPEAVVQLIDSTLDAGQKVPVALAESAAALASEARGTSVGMELRRVYLRNKAHSDGGLEVLRETENAAQKEEISQEAAASLRQEIYEFAVQNTSDPSYLGLVLESPLQLGNTVEAVEVRRAIAMRLIDLELPVQARDVLSEDVSVPEPEDRKIYARAFLAERRPDLAMGYLAGLSDEDAIALRALAHEQAGEFDRAAESYGVVDNSEARARSLWRGQIWAEVVEAGTEQEKAAVGLLLEDKAQPEDTSKVLAMNRRMLEQSQTTRTILQNLMDSAPIP